MIRKSGSRFSEKIMLKQKKSMSRKSGNWFSDEDMRKQKILKAKSSMARA
jgi:hypothetical protein